MRFLLTGGSGFIGSNLARILVERGHQVVALVRKTSVRKDLEKAGATFAVGDLLSGDGLAEAVADVDCVLHLAGVTKALTADDYHRGNADGTRKLCEAISQTKKPAKLVFCSSLSAAGPAKVGKPKTESDDPTPISTYGRSKLAGELAVRQFADRVPSVIVRPPIVYGPADKEFLPSLLPMARFGFVLKSGFGPKHFSLIHVMDLCEALYAAALRGKTISKDDPSAGLYFVSDGREYSWEEVCGSLMKALGRGKALVLPLPDVVSYAAGLGSELQAQLRGVIPILNRDKAREMRCEAWTCSTERAKSEMAYVPAFGLDQGFKDTIDWYRKEGWL